MCVCVVCRKLECKYVTKFLSGLSNVQPGCGIVQLSSPAVTLNQVMQDWVLPV